MNEPSGTLCSCGRMAPELGCDLCALCRQEYEERQQERERERLDEAGNTYDPQDGGW